MAQLKQDAPLRCSCNDIFALEEKCGYLFGHAWIKGEDVKDDLLKKVMSILANSKPRLMKEDEDVAVIGAINMIL